MSCGMSSASARSPSAARSPGSAPGPPLWPGTWKRTEPRAPYAHTASRYGATGCSSGGGAAGRSGASSGTGGTGAMTPSSRLLRLGLLGEGRADEAVEVAVEHAPGGAELEVGPVVLDHGVRVQDVGADLRPEVHVERLAARLGDLLAAAALLELDELGAEHGHRGRAVGRLRALVLALNHDAGRLVGDPDRRVGLVDVLAAGARGAI